MSTTSIISRRSALVATLFFLTLLASCGAQREVAYISDAERDTAQAILSNFAATIHPGDRLYIYVNSQTPESVIPFNEETKTMTGKIVATGIQSGGGVVDGYLVSEGGTITFPVLGVIPVAGLTHDSLAHEIEIRLQDGGYVNDAVVTVSLMNFRVAVVGEVRVPREIHVPGIRLTIFEALALCGDVTMYGQRENVVVVRQNMATDGVDPEGDPAMAVEVGQIDLTSKDIFNSPYYYLRSGDIVYVEPTDQKKKKAFRDPNTLNYISVAVSVAHLVAGISRTISGIYRTQ